MSDTTVIVISLISIGISLLSIGLSIGMMK